MINFLTGSHLFGSNNGQSDKDYISVYFDDTDLIFAKNHRKNSNPNDDYIYFSENEFQGKLNSHDIRILECYYSGQNKEFCDSFYFKLDKTILRNSISTVASHSWVKGKKKLTVLSDYDLFAGLKSIFHSLRILDYGLQIAHNGKITDFTSMNYVLLDLWKMSEKDTHYELWSKIDGKYRSQYNSLKSQFKMACPIVKQSQKMFELKSYFAKENINLTEKQINNVINILK